MVSGEVKDNVHPVGGLLGDTGVAEIGPEEFDAPLADVFADVLKPAATQVVDDANRGAAICQCIDQVGADERRPTRNEYPAIFPVHRFALLLCAFFTVGLDATGRRSRPPWPSVSPDLLDGGLTRSGLASLLPVAAAIFVEGFVSEARACRKSFA